MEKFSLYDLLGLLLPGFLFVYFCTVLNALFNVCPFLVDTNGLDISLGILLCFALITGAMLYAVNFWLVNYAQWYNRLFKMNKHVTDLYLEMKTLHKFMNETLNRKATEWYGKEIFYTRTKFKSLIDADQKQIKELQDEYYDRMYNELEYINKIDTPKTFQSFYYFFRQLVTANLVLLTAGIILQVTSLFSFSGLCHPSINTIISIPSVLSVVQSAI